MEEVKQLPIAQRVRMALSSPEVEAEFTALAATSANIVAITNEAGYSECHAARMRLVKARTNTVAKGKAVRQDATDFSKGVIAEENRLIGLIQPEEKRLQALQDAEDAMREEKIQAERARVERIELSISAIEQTPLRMAGKPAAEIANSIEVLKANNLGAWAMEFTAKAEAVKDSTLAALEQLHAGAMATEKAAAEAAAKLKAEQEELARLRAEQAKRDAEAAANAEAERQRQDEARAQIQREQIAAQNAREEADRIAKAARDKADEEARATREAEEARLRKQREEIEAKQRAADEEARKVREALEAKAAADRKAKEEAEREIERQRLELADGQTVLTVFKDRFGKRREFAGVVKAIDTYFSKAAERKAA